MAKKKTAAPAAASSVTPERAGRLHRLLRMLGKSGQTRAALLRRLGLNVRGFYRDLETLRASGIQVTLVKDRYLLSENAESAILRLPFPDAGLTIGEARLLAKGRTEAHKKLQALLKRIEK